MAANYESCNLNALLKDSSCLQLCFGEESLLAFDLVVRIAALADEGSTNYTGAGGLTKLLSDARAWVANGQLNKNSRAAIASFIDWQNALEEGGTVPTTVNGVMKLSAGYRALDPETKRNLILYLKCRLNSLDEPG